MAINASERQPVKLEYCMETWVPDVSCSFVRVLSLTDTGKKHTASEDWLPDVRARALLS